MKNSTTDISLLKQASAWLPIAMSLLACSIVVLHLIIFGTAREADEGAAAHIWQLLMGAQIPMLGFFIAKWLPVYPKRTLQVCALQALAALAAIAPLIFFDL